MKRRPVVAAVDWGTTSFRLWIMDDTGEVVGMSESRDGVEAIADKNFPGVLDAHLRMLDAPPLLPVIMCGMIGARQGWREAPYLDVPAQLASILDRAIYPDPSSPHICILPGLAKRVPDFPDVMRGEETQLLGFCLQTVTPSGLFCLPGTHSKFVTLKDGCVVDFSTAMTGDMYAMLTQHSVLRHLPHSSDVLFSHLPGSDFHAGLEHGLNKPDRVLRNLFGLRARSLLFPSSDSEPRAFLSGLLIGLEIASLPKQSSNAHVTLIGSKALLPSYEAGFSLAGYRTQSIDGNSASRLGLFYAACKLWPDTIRRIPHDAA